MDALARPCMAKGGQAQQNLPIPRSSQLCSLDKPFTSLFYSLLLYLVRHRWPLPILTLCGCCSLLSAFASLKLVFGNTGNGRVSSSSSDCRRREGKGYLIRQNRRLSWVLFLWYTRCVSMYVRICMYAYVGAALSASSFRLCGSLFFRVNVATPSLSL